MPCNFITYIHYIISPSIAYLLKIKLINRNKYHMCTNVISFNIFNTMNKDEEYSFASGVEP